VKLRDPHDVLRAFPQDELYHLAAELFEELRRISTDGPGVTREPFGTVETAAQDLMAGVAREHGLGAERDRVSNLVITLPGRDPHRPFLATGSHLDSVPQGGNYDGAAGVVAGLLALVALRRLDITPERTVRLYALRGEESCWFGKSWIGSHALFGRLTAQDLARPRYDDPRSLRSWMEAAGADVTAIGAGVPLLDPVALAGFIEVHIEQGPVLEAQGLPLGVVTGIYGNLRHMNVVARGQAAHAGATPRFLRRDAVIAAAEFMMRMDEHWREWLERGRQIVITHGIVGTVPGEHAVSRVPGEVRFSVELRADDAAHLAQFHALVLSEAAATGERRGVEFVFDEAIVNPPAPMHESWIERLERLCAEALTPCVARFGETRAARRDRS
jgi:beta-ureidopropionase / N-carbamoyl-L-amino-acid hydrolase